MHELSQKETCSEIWEALDDLPSGLPAMYSRMLLHIPAERRGKPGDLAVGDYGCSPSASARASSGDEMSDPPLD
jgi:hypothetical protein